jgi:preprotein translocase subunit YajC
MDSLWILALAYPLMIVVLFYFAFLRPVQQEQKKQRSLLHNLRVGDEVLTQGGLIARVKDVRIPEEKGPTELVLDLGGGVEVRAVASAVAQRLTPTETDRPVEQTQTIETATAEAKGHS